MPDFFDEITPDDIRNFRETFREFERTEKIATSETGTRTPQVGARLLDLLLDPEFSNNEEFRLKTCEMIGRICELDALDLPGEKAASIDLLAIALNYKNQFLKQLESHGLDRKKESLWRNRIQEFFDRFTLELVKRWEGIEAERYRVEIKIREDDEKILRRENARLRGIYTLSLEIATIENPDKIYNYLAQKLPYILPYDVLFILDCFDRKIIEHVYSNDRLSPSMIESTRRKVEDVYELFKREVLDRQDIILKTHPNTDREMAGEKAEPESVVIPMIDGENTWGMIGVFRKDGYSFDPQEVQALSIVTNMVDLVVRNQRAITRERHLARSLDEQIAFARTVQENMVAGCYPGDDFIVHTRFKPAKTLSGDFYQFFKTDLGERGVIIGDVTGHGVAAGMMMMTVMGILSEVILLENTTLPEMLKRANLRLNRMISEEFFVTALAFWVDENNALKYFNMGHPPGLHLKSGTGKIEELPPVGFPLGIFSEIDVTPSEIDFQPGDKILLYTDGIIEAKNESGKIYGIDRLKKAFTSSSQNDGERILEILLDSANSHAGTRGVHDDIALVLIEN